MFKDISINVSAAGGIGATGGIGYAGNRKIATNIALTNGYGIHASVTKSHNIMGKKQMVHL
ncbi:hypothetical protein [Neisseria zalophi]|uniref:Uncharacterized protein n=1 Tax=Neisseria zalophi TaxID=640030 RepID=A0A5J6PZ48_9NEIS|nr:hypothetical protein [Neisseria zalophi]QEY26182.1 hypothetical protein D0T92_06350 [Neisseria zalophi]